MTGTFELGDNYSIDENSNGNLIIKDSTGSIVLKHEDGGNFQLGSANLELGDLIDGSTGNTVYDGSTETLGDGTQAGDFNSLSTERADIDDLTIGKDLDKIEDRFLSFGLSTGDANQGITSKTVDTSATDIATFARGGMAIIQGEKEGDSGVRFIDIVLKTGAGVSNVSSETDGSPDSRNYSSLGGTLQLEMGANSYDVTGFTFQLTGGA